MNTLEKIFGGRIERMDDGTYLLRYGKFVYVRVRGVVDDILIVNIFSQNEKDWKLGYYTTTISDAIHSRLDNIDEAQEYSTKLVSKFGYTFELARYDKFYVLRLGSTEYYCNLNFSLTIEGLIKYAPDFICNKGLRFGHVYATLNSVDWNTHKAELTCTNTFTGAKAILTTSLSVLNRLRTLDLIRSDKRLYPDRHFNYIDVVVNDITVHGLVYYKVIKLVGDKKCSGQECMPYDMFVVADYGEFLGAVKENCKQAQRNNNWYIDSSQSRMEDVYYAIKDAGISMDLEQFRGYF